MENGEWGMENKMTGWQDSRIMTTIRKRERAMNAWEKEGAIARETYFSDSF